MVNDVNLERRLQGVGMTSARTRLRMVERLFAQGRRQAFEMQRPVLLGWPMQGRDCFCGQWFCDWSLEKLDARLGFLRGVQTRLVLLSALFKIEGPPKDRSRDYVFVVDVVDVPSSVGEALLFSRAHRRRWAKLF